MSPEVQAEIERRRGGGHTLDAEFRARLQPHLGHDLGDVRLHTDSHADALSRALSARAFTVGSDIFFRSGAYRPGTYVGDRLIAHELAHVVQQTAMNSGSLLDGGSSDPWESDANTAADAVVSTVWPAGSVAGESAPSSGAGQRLQAAERTAGHRPLVAHLQGRPGHPVLQRDAQATPVQREDRPRRKVRTSKRLTDVEAKVKRLENKIRALGHLDAFRDAVLARAEGWENAVIDLGSAYSKAARKHIGAVEEKKKVDAIESQVMFSVLTIVTAGALAWVSSAVQAGKIISKEMLDEHKMLFDVLKDTVGAAGGEVFSANGPGVAQRVPTPAQVAVSEDPFEFQNQRLARVKANTKTAYLYFEAWDDALLVFSDEWWDKYDEKQQINAYADWRKMAGLLATDANLQPVEYMAAEIERGFWKMWIPSLRQKQVTYGSKVPYTHLVYTSPGSAIEKRWDELGITTVSGVGDFGWWTSHAELDKVVEWANSYRVKAFISGT